jgi:hypothetical protein
MSLSSCGDRRGRDRMVVHKMFHCSNKCTLNVRLLKKMNIKCSFDEEEFEDTKEVIRILISKKNRQHKSQMVVRCTTTCTTSAYHHWCCEFESCSWRDVQHYVIKFVGDLPQVGCFLRVLQFPPPIKPKNIQRINNIFVMVSLRMVN